MTANRHSIFYGVDLWTVLLYVLIVLAGWVSITSASYDEGTADIFSFSHFYMKQLMWIGVAGTTARVVLRYKITPDGETVVQQELESTDNRLKRRVLKAVAEAPRWHPAQKNGAPVESEGVLSIQLPEGRRMPRQAELVIR